MTNSTDDDTGPSLSPTVQFTVTFYRRTSQPKPCVKNQVGLVKLNVQYKQILIL